MQNDKPYDKEFVRKLMKEFYPEHEKEIMEASESESDNIPSRNKRKRSKRKKV